MRIFILRVFVLVLIVFLMKTYSEHNWKVGDESRPRPPVIEAGTQSTNTEPGQPPSDAIVLFNGVDLSEWRTGDDEKAQWEVRDGYMECVEGAGSIYSVRKFGNCQLHVEWSAPLPVKDEGQGRGNSGVYLMSNYEVQVLDSYQNDTYPDGQAAALYGQFPPLVNACRPPGEWQTYDIIFHRPHFDARGRVIKPARITVLHNGVLVQDNVELLGPTTHELILPYHYHERKLPVLLQNHKNPVRYRNIWVRELPESNSIKRPLIAVKKMEPADLDKYKGRYKVQDEDLIVTIKRQKNQLVVQNLGLPEIPIFPLSNSESGFFTRTLETSFRFQYDEDGIPLSVEIMQGGIRTLKAEKIH
jgi:hypothetical protein